MIRNKDSAVIRDFGQEWRKFDQTVLSDEEHQRMFDAYFGIFPWDHLPENAVGFDLGCGSGRWAVLVAPRVGELHCIEPSEEALSVAHARLAKQVNCRFYHAGIDDMPLADVSMDFGYSLGVLHHVPDTAMGLSACVRKLKNGAPFLLYLYYALDNRPYWYRLLWRVSDLPRRVLSRFPFWLKYPLTQIIAAFVYWPLARGARLLERFGRRVEGLPLSAYRHSSFYTMRTDALDRFGTRLEQRFSRTEIEQMMRRVGLADIRFSDSPPFWCAVGFREQDSGTGA